jgi:hypothetical protein
VTDPRYPSRSIMETVHHATSKTERALFRSSIILRAVTWKRRQQPSSRASTLLTGYFRSFNTHNKCTGVCRFVRGIPVGIGRRVAELWGFCGARRSLRLARPTLRGVPTYRDFQILVTTFQ